MHVRRLFAFCVLSAVFPLSEAAAQGMKVSTIVKDALQLDAAGNETVASSSYTLFHNGRVYDYVEAAGEVVIFDPTARKFTLLNTQRNVTTTVAFPQLKKLLDARGPRIRQYIKELKASGAPDADRASRLLNFQLQPKFETKYASFNGRLKMEAASWKYTVSTQEWPDADQVKRYLEYADGISRLNCVLHPSGMFPEPRLALNEQLRELENRMPVLVHLNMRPDSRVVMQAEHKFTNNLSDADHKLIANWNKMLQSGELKSLPVLGYQEAVLLSGR